MRAFKKKLFIFKRNLSNCLLHLEDFGVFFIKSSAGGLSEAAGFPPSPPAAAHLLQYRSSIWRTPSNYTHRSVGVTLDATRSLTDEVGEQHGQQGRGRDGAHRRALPAAVLGRLLELEGRAREGVPGQQARGRRVDRPRGQGVAGRGAAEEGGRPRGRLEQEVPEEEEGEEKNRHGRSDLAGVCVCVRRGDGRRRDNISVH